MPYVVHPVLAAPGRHKNNLPNSTIKPILNSTGAGYSLAGDYSGSSIGYRNWRCPGLPVPFAQRDMERDDPSTGDNPAIGPVVTIMCRFNTRAGWEGFSRNAVSVFMVNRG
jgi:hypothetical protein